MPTNSPYIAFNNYLYRQVSDILSNQGIPCVINKTIGRNYEEINHLEVMTCGINNDKCKSVLEKLLSEFKGLKFYAPNNRDCICVEVE